RVEHKESAIYALTPARSSLANISRQAKKAGLSLRPAYGRQALREINCHQRGKGNTTRKGYATLLHIIILR
ncbi:MAG TPA: hypothetical protein VK618_12185, partial [Flavitalea sp.]|nr:hypothetical protein [Flavitalea sp.]